MTDSADRRRPYGAEAGDGFARVRPRLGVSDLAVQFWRAKWLMLATALPVVLLGLLGAAQMPTHYQSRSAFYVTESADGRPQGEVELFQTRIVAERALSRFPLSRINPRLDAAMQAGDAQAPSHEIEGIRDAYFQRGVDLLRANLSAAERPNSTIVSVSLRHPDPDIAAELLNAAMAAYLQHREALFKAGTTLPLLEEDRLDEADLLAVEAQVTAFLSANNLRDFDRERATASELQRVIGNALVSVQAQRTAALEELSQTRARLAQTPEELDLFVEDSRAASLLALEIKRNQALVTYAPESRRVQILDRQIAELRAFIDAQNDLVGTVRRGLNPTHQALQEAANALSAEAAALQAQEAELQRQAQLVETNLDRLAGLDPEWRALQRQRDAIARALSQTAGADWAAPTLGGQKTLAAVVVTEPAAIPSRGESGRGVVIAVSGLIALLAALIAGSLRAYSRPGFATAGSLRTSTQLRVFGAVGAAGRP